jgi:hypothetical protein
MKQTNYSCDWCMTTIGREANSVSLRPAFPKRDDWPEDLEIREQLDRLKAMMEADQEHRKRYRDVDLCDRCYLALERWIEGWKKEHQ